ncbi:LpxI family protein [Salinarimonas soli]|uniref:LpxI family protein n=2 Tax=Salinarimonas soli TaxID=1638099 RepID=A0A5B2VEL5_9HYPH|nr:LpxI family protein [Salinarimonas soli]
MARCGRAHRLLAFRGFAERDVRRRADAVIDLLDVGRALGTMRGWGAGAVTLAGAVTRPNPAAALGAFAYFRNRHELDDLLSGGDDHVLRRVVERLEARGFPVVGVHDLAPSLLAKEGAYGRVRPAPEDEASIAVGLGLLRDLSPHDVGQAAVVASGHVTAVEGPEGTDRMLDRARRFSIRRPFGRPVVGAGVLVKAAKRGQDMRVDLPTIGPRTVENAARAGLRGIAIGAGSTLVLEEARTVALADQLELYLVGVPWSIGREDP